MIHELGQLVVTGLGSLVLTTLVLAIALTVAVPAFPYLLLVLLLIGVANSQLKPTLARKQLLALSCATFTAVLAPALVTIIAAERRVQPDQGLWKGLIAAIYLLYAALLLALWPGSNRSERYGILLYWTTGAYLVACVAYASIKMADELIDV